MPLGDGTGPLGLGPQTGRKRGWCSGRSYRIKTRRKSSLILWLILPVVAMGVFLLNLRSRLHLMFQKRNKTALMKDRYENSHCER